jgi:hypothetical protein
MRKTLLILLLIWSAGYFSQEKGKRNAPITVRGNIGIPRTISSKMFRTAFNGVYEGGLSVNGRLFNNFFAGIGYQNTHLQNNRKVFVYYQVPSSQKTGGATLSYNTRMTAHCGYLKLGYDKFFEKGYVSYALNSGYAMVSYLNVVDDSSAVNLPFQDKKYSTPYVQPEIAINFMADRALGFSIMLSYTTLFYKFDPRAPRFAHIGQVKESKNNYLISWINIGFGFTVMIGD